MMSATHFVFDGPYRSARLRPCSIERAAPYLRGNAPDGAYVYWRDLPVDADSSVSRGGWVSAVYTSVEAALAARG